MVTTKKRITSERCNLKDGLKNLKAHSQMFRKEIIRITDNVYAAVGYSVSVCSMIIGDDGIIIIDTSEGIEAARGVLKEFRKITDKPIKAIVLTHGHRDHVSGASVFAEEGNKPEIYARTNLFNPLDTKHLNKIGPFKALQHRTIRQFGIKWLEPHTERVNMGLGPAIRPEKGLGEGFVDPTKTFANDKLVITETGVTLELHKAPGETDDTLFVWMPDRKVLLCGDNFYQTFPNLYAIRGTKYRDFNKWTDSLDIMISFPAEHLIPGHTRPISGHTKIIQALCDYRDAIRYIISKTAEGMNKGLYPDELVEYVKLPGVLAEKYHLQEFYGSVAWSVRAYASGELGWFDGNPTNLFPTPAKEKAQRMAKLAGGRESLFNQMQEASEKGEHQWAMELADIIIALNFNNDQAIQVKVTALKSLADEQINACARNYYLTYAKELIAGKVTR